MKKTLFGSLVAIALLLTACDGTCESAKKEREKKIIQGKIVSTDWVASAITVKRMEFDVGPVDEEVTMTVSNDIPITKGTEKLEFADLKEEDRVIAQYRDEEGELETALKIEVRESL